MAKRSDSGWWPAERLEAWLEKMGMNNTQAAQALGCQRATIVKYRSDGAPRFIGLAARALADGKKPF